MKRILLLQAGGVMRPSDYYNLLERAAASERGLALNTTRANAILVRRRLYKARDRARASGDTSLDHLSFLLQRSGQLWIVRRDKLPSPDPDEREDHLHVSTEPLTTQKLPKKVLARGPTKPRFTLIPGLLVDEPDP